MIQFCLSRSTPESGALLCNLRRIYDRLATAPQGACRRHIRSTKEMANARKDQGSELVGRRLSLEHNRVAEHGQRRRSANLGRQAGV